MQWQKLREEQYRAGYRRMVRRTFRLPDGKEADYDIKVEGPAACILALTPKEQVILVEFYRPGPERLLKELPGGLIEADEDPLAAMARELLEETGYTGNIELVGTAVDDAYSTMLRYNFIARNCTKIAEPTGDEDEFGRVVLMSLDEFRQHLRSGELTDIETGYLGLDYLGKL